MMKSGIDKVPESDQKEFNEAKANVGNLAGGAMQNPLGDFVSSKGGEMSIDKC